MRITVHDDYTQMSRAAAEMVAQLLWEKPEARLGLATGATPMGLYEDLVRLHREEGLSFQRAVCFNLDEYVGLATEAPESYHSYMRQCLFDHVDLLPSQCFLPDGSAPDARQAAAEYAFELDRWGPMDLQVLGIGANGHIGFNEPGSAWDSRTRVLDLDESTRRANASFFNGNLERVPRQAITVGIADILSARRILLLASGSGKAEIIKAALYGSQTEQIPASALQRHPDVVVLLDREAARSLSTLRSR